MYLPMYQKARRAEPFARHRTGNKYTQPCMHLMCLEYLNLAAYCAAEPFLALAAYSRFKYLKRPLIGV